MTLRPPSGFPLPELVLVAGRVLGEEGEDLRAALSDFSGAPQPGCPWSQDDELVPAHAGWAGLLRYTRHQAVLIYVNAYDHLLTLSRVLGGDGAMPLFSQASLSRVVCEAAARFAWLMDPGTGSHERITREAAALFVSEQERYRGVRGLPAEHFDKSVLRQMYETCTAEREALEELIAGAGLTFGYSQNGKTKTRLELESPALSVPLKLNVTGLMAELLPDSPSWYNIGSSVTHSYYWGLRDVDGSHPGDPLALTPNVLAVGAAAMSAISASGLILERCGRCFGHDTSAQLQRTRERRAAIDVLMRRAATSTWIPVPAEGEKPGAGRKKQ